MKKVLLTAAAFLTMSATTIATAQVIIGSLDNPQTFSILELESDNGKRGLRLPHLTADERNDLEQSLAGNPQAPGLQIFNTTTRCVETWNGTKWIEKCAELEVVSPQIFCSAGTVSVSSLVAYGVNIKWYDSETGGTALDATTSLQDGAHTYYVTQTFNGTESARKAVEVKVSSVETPQPTAYDKSFCGSDFTVANLEAYGTKYCTECINWYESVDGPKLNPEDEIHNGTYYVSQTQNGCESQRKLVTVTVNTPPALPTFMAYNLGADPNLNTPKDQMAYLATHNYSNDVERMLDASVNGGLYQWGRKDTLYAVNATTYKRYIGDGTTTVSMSDDQFELTNNFYNMTTGQPLSPKYANKHIYDAGGTNNYDWIVYSENPPSPFTYDSELGMSPGRWGNGVAVKTATPDGGVSYDGSYYQNPVKTDYDPCPTGYRIPTQDEWERVSSYDCNPSQSGVSDLIRHNYDYGDIITTVGQDLTWVPVVCNKDNSGKCVPSKNDNWGENSNGSEDDRHQEFITGYAVYNTSEWNAAGIDYKNGTVSLHDDYAPNPYLYLPLAGYRNGNDPALEDSGAYGLYMSSTLESTSAYVLSLNYGSVSTEMQDRSRGFSIRCVVK
jgi:hypothetical protein